MESNSLGPASTLSPGTEFRYSSSFCPRDTATQTDEREVDVSESSSPGPPKRLFLPKVLRLPAPGRSRSFDIEQAWLGVVLEKGQDCIVARLVDNSGGPELEGEIPISQIVPDDLDLVEEGAEFYWNVGYMVDGNGVRRRSSLLRFKRLPKWDSARLTKVRELARQRMALFED